MMRRKKMKKNDDMNNDKDENKYDKIRDRPR